MPSVFQKPGRKQWYARIKGVKKPGKWGDVPTGETDRERAERYAKEAQRGVDRRNGVVSPDVVTLREYVKRWTEMRREADQDWKKDLGRLENHVLPELGGCDITEISAAQIASLVHDLRFKKHLANRTVRNIYTVLSSVFRDARLDKKVGERLKQTPCILTEKQLGPVLDKDPTWRPNAKFAREEAERMISARHIPLDRQLVYAFGLIAGLRIGEGAALRWRNYDATREPLGCLTVALSYSTTRGKEKGTKTNAVRFVPVHPVLAEMLAQWRIGWEKMFGRAPGPDDLIVPLPPDVKLTKRVGERFRGFDYTGRRWREIDEPKFGWRHRSVYDTKSTFITLAIDDGARRDILRDRVTHTKPRRDAFDGYDRGEHWIETCREVAKLKIRRLADVLLTKEVTVRDDSLRRRVSNVPTRYPELRVIQGGREVIPSACDLGMALLSATCGRDDQGVEGEDGAEKETA
jgi:integrase